MSTVVRTPASVEDEAAVLGAILLSDRVLPRFVVDEGLRAEHFYRRSYGDVFAAMVRLLDAGEPVDPQTVWTELERTRSQRDDAYEGLSRNDVYALTAEVPSATNVRAYARRVRELARLRQKQQAAYGILAAVESEDLEALADAESGLNETAETKKTFTPLQLADEASAFLNSDGGERWSLPWPRLTRGLTGGLRRGTVTVIGGHSSHGKSVVADQVVGHIVKKYDDVNATVYINEMTRHERVLRHISSAGSVPLDRLMQPDRTEFSDAEWQRMNTALGSVPWTLVEAEGWTAAEIARHLRVQRPDIAVIDIFQLIATARGETRDWDEASRLLNAAAKQANCALIITAHLNESRAMTVRPKPVLGDIRNTGQLKNDADNVLFVWREQASDGSEVYDEGVIYVAKARMGVQGVSQDVHFRSERMQFLAVDPDHEPTHRPESDGPTSPTSTGEDIPF